MEVPLIDHHIALGAKMVDFAVWQMPLHYSGILDEHKAVRENVGLFDVSHMARVEIVGKEASKFLEFAVTKKLKSSGKATYACMCNGAGGTVDDLIVYKESDESLFIVLNASRRSHDLAHLHDLSLNFDVKINEVYPNEAILALQGPNTNQYFPLVTKPMSFERRGDLIVSSTGYTGAGGVEIFGPSSSIVKLWEQLIEKGVKPIGLGARDTLRLEKGYALYGHELSESIAPTESVSAWTVDFDKDFYGKEKLPEFPRQAAGIIIEGNGLAREGFAIFKENNEIGQVTSGGFSPTLKKSIALILSDAPLFIGEQIFVQIRGQKVAARVTPLPFI